MGDYEQRCREDARLAILAELARQRDATLNSLSITRVVDALGIRRSRDWVEDQLATVRADRERSQVLRDQQALIRGNVEAVQSFRGALEQTVADALRGRFSLGSILTSIGNSAINLASQRIVEQLFGSTLHRPCSTPGPRRDA